MHPIIEKYLEILMRMFEYDIAVMSKPWMIYTIVPIIGYLVFFFIKWAVLTAPVWLPFSIVVNSGRQKRFSKKKK